MKKVFLLSLVTLAVLSICDAQTTDLRDSSDLIAEFKNSEFRTSKTLEKMSNSFLKFINKNGWNLVMVNFGEDYNTTDIEIKDTSNSMLVEFGISKDGLCIMIFDLGGYVVTRRAFLFKKLKRGYVTRDLLLDTTVSDISGLRDFLERMGM